MRFFPVFLVAWLAAAPLAIKAQPLEFGTLAATALRAVENDEVVYNQPHLRLTDEFATLSAAHIRQRDLKPLSPEGILFHEQILIELYRRHLFPDHARRRELLTPYFARMEMEIALALAANSKGAPDELAQRARQVGGRNFQLLTEGIKRAIMATGGPPKVNAISSTFANPPLRLDMVPARRFEIEAAPAWLLQRARFGDEGVSWQQRGSDQEVALQGVYTIRVKRSGWYDYYKLSLDAGPPRFQPRPPASLAPELAQQPFETIERLAAQIVKDRTVEMFEPKFEWRESPERTLVYDLGNPMLESLGPAYNFQAFDSLVRVAAVRHYHVTTPDRRALWNPILARVTGVIREEFAYLRRHGVMTDDKRMEFGGRVDRIYEDALAAYAGRHGYAARRVAVKAARNFSVVFQTSDSQPLRVYYIPNTEIIIAKILGQPVPFYKWKAIFTGVPLQLTAGDYFWAMTREENEPEPFDENADVIRVD